MLQTPQFQRRPSEANGKQIVGVSTGRQIAPGANELREFTEADTKKGRRPREIEEVLMVHERQCHLQNKKAAARCGCDLGYDIENIEDNDRFVNGYCRL
jgi:hypothetical protein